MQGTNQNLKQKVNNLPGRSGCYIMKNISGDVLYVGKAKNLKSRVSSYFINTYKLPKVAELVSHIYDFDYIITNSEADALALENNLIKKHKPFYNTLLKDDKHYAFLRINLKDRFPRIEVVRRITKDGAKYFGPYFGGVRVWELLKIINHTFLLRDCTRKISVEKPHAKPCLNFHIERCSGACINKINMEDYLSSVQRAINFLNGDHNTAKQMITNKMKLVAENENFERAIELRDDLKIIDNLNSKVVTNLNKVVDIDVFGYATDGYNSVISVLVIRGGKMIGASNFMIIDAEELPQSIISNFISKYYPESSTVPSEIVCEFEISDAVAEYVNKLSDKQINIITPKKATKKQLLDMANINASEYLNKNLETAKLKWLKTEGAMLQLQKDLNLKNLPRRIEGYDISNMQGGHIVASMVVFIDGAKSSGHYRKFKIETVVGQNNDFDSMKEVITRRFNNLNSKDQSFSQMPDLVLIDGGKGQLSVALEAIKNINNNNYNGDIGLKMCAGGDSPSSLKLSGEINGLGNSSVSVGVDFICDPSAQEDSLESCYISSDVVSLAKRVEEIFVPNNPQGIYLNRDNRGLQLLQQVRDEAHRFALSFHRALRQKTSIASELTNIEGVGKQTAKLLLQYFGTISKIKNAQVGDIIRVKGVGRAQAENIYNYFRSKAT